MKALDLERAVKNVDIDIRGDWYRDPWGWPEVRWALKRDPETFTKRLNSEGVRRCAPIDVPKENFAVRPAIVLDPIDRVIYQALVDRLSPELIGSQPDWVYGWRLPPGSDDRGRYARNDYQWENFRTQLNGLAGWFEVGLKTDVVSFFASVELNSVADLVSDLTGTGAVQTRLLDLLDGWSHVAGRSGLPQRSMASAVLANAFLRPVDDVLAHHGAVDVILTKLEIVPHGAACRWMDDVWLFGEDAAELRSAQLELQRELEAIGLRMNFAKTDVLEGDALVAEARQIEHSAVDDGLIGEPVDRGPLNELIDALLGRPEHASRTSVRFACSRMREHEALDRVGDMVDKADRMPHGADHLSRLFRESEAWRDLDRWYLDYRSGAWASIDWSVAQLGTMFPSDTSVTGVAEAFGEILASANSSLPVTTLAAQRLAAWDEDAARLSIREASRSADQPLERRSLALAALAAGEGRKFVKGLLNEFEDNSVTLSMLEETGFKAPKVLRDFAA